MMVVTEYETNRDRAEPRLPNARAGVALPQPVILIHSLSQQNTRVLGHGIFCNEPGT
jgi:hypothetical protein